LNILGLRQTAPRAATSPFRQAEVLMSSFARANHGLYILDGPAIGTDPNRQGTELDVYCLFKPGQMHAATQTARRALAGFGQWRISYLKGTDFAGDLLTFLSRRGHVLGERRSGQRLGGRKASGRICRYLDLSIAGSVDSGILPQRRGWVIAAAFRFPEPQDAASGSGVAAAA
jgi:hypothetical protein